MQATPDPKYIYPGQWMDELSSLSSLTPGNPRVAVDLQMSIPDTDALNPIAGALFGSQLPPYQE